MLAQKSFYTVGMRCLPVCLPAFLPSLLLSRGLNILGSDLKEANTIHYGPSGDGTMFPSMFVADR
ncbi:hypothetical protein ACTXT7_014427 [Hymenolepis weldensis]